MARNYLLIISTVFLIVSCAQIGTISGGVEDYYAPVPDMEHADPPNESTFFNGHRIIIPFNEYFTIQNPTSSITMVPPHATIRSSFKGKKLILEWDEELKANTTYSIYLDKAIRDITEGNDSLIQFVFSTGDKIDTTRYTGMVIDAYSQLPVEDIYAVLRNPSDSSIVSYARSDESGQFTLNYLPSGTYHLALIQESIKDLSVGPGEAVAFKENGSITMDGAAVDTIPFLLSTPISRPQINSANYADVGMITIGANYPIDPASLSLDQISPSLLQIKEVDPDSVILFLPADFNYSGKHTLRNTFSSYDSLSVRMSKKEDVSGSITSATKENKAFPSQGIALSFNDLIQSVDYDHIHIFNATDSSVISADSIIYAYNDLFIKMNVPDVQKVLIMIDSAAIRGTHVNNSLYEGVFTLLKPRELGTINLDLTEFSSALILDVFKDNKSVQRLYINDPSQKIKLTELLPGTYSFRIVEDSNANRIWDSCDYSEKKQAERVSYFSPDNKLRANWEIDLKLVPED